MNAQIIKALDGKPRYVVRDPVRTWEIWGVALAAPVVFTGLAAWDNSV